MTTLADNYRFGPYELRTRARELCKHGTKVKLRPQPFQVLKALVERAGDVLTREELRELLWPKETFVDFEHGLNAAISELRGVLNDAASNPRYIETLPKVGYRISVPVEAVAAEDVAVPERKTARISSGESVPPTRQDLGYASPAHLDESERGRALRPSRAGNELPPPNPAGRSPGSARSLSLLRWRFVVPLLAAAALALATSVWFQRTERFWRSPTADARFQKVTDFNGTAQAAAVSRDGHFVAFLSDRDGQMDVWVTQVGSGQFHNLTRGSAPELVNPSVRTLGFSPDGSLVTFWVRKPDSANGADIGIWAVPALGGQPSPYLEGVSEYEWSRDGSRVVYHTPGPGDPLFVSDGNRRSDNWPIYTAPAGLHSHFPSWAPDGAYIYFVQGSPPDKMDIWRIAPTGGTPEQITSHNGRVSYPVLLDRRTLLYLASDPDGSGPWLYSMDVERRNAHRLGTGLEWYTSLAASADGRRMVVTMASPTRTLWRLQIADSTTEMPTAQRIPLTTGTGFAPRLGPNYLLYVSATSTSESVWKLANGTGTELWGGQGARIFGGPAISPDGRKIAFSVRQHGQTLLYVMQADGTSARVVSDAVDLQGAPAWAPDGHSITSAADDHGVTHLLQIPVDGHPPTVFVKEYAIDPTWAPDGRFVVYSGPDIGTMFTVKAVTAEAAAHPMPTLKLTRGARHLGVLDGGRALALLRGDIQHKNLWLIDLKTGTERQLTNFAPDFDVRDFDISPDGREVVLERAQERSDVLLLDLPRP